MSTCNSIHQHYAERASLQAPANTSSSVPASLRHPAGVHTESSWVKYINDINKIQAMQMRADSISEQFFGVCPWCGERQPTWEGHVMLLASRTCCDDGPERTAETREPRSRHTEPKTNQNHQGNIPQLSEQEWPFVTIQSQRNCEMKEERIKTNRSCVSKPSVLSSYAAFLKRFPDVKF